MLVTNTKIANILSSEEISENDEFDHIPSDTSNNADENYRIPNKKDLYDLKKISSSTDDSNGKTYVSFASKTDVGTRIYDKRHACYFCYKLVCKLTRHLETIHEKEMEVAKLLAKEKQSKERKEGFLCILRAGDYFHNCEVLSAKSGKLILSRRPSTRHISDVSVRDYGPCPQCLGFFLLSHLWHHVKHFCPKNSCNEATSDSQMAVSRRDVRGESLALVGPYYISEEFKKCILASLKSDCVSDACKNDEIILRLGNLLFEKHSSQQHEYIRQTLRQVGRLVITAREIDNKILGLSELLQPANFDCVILAVKELCKSNLDDMKQQSYNIPSLALKLGHSLRKCALILRGMSLRKGDLETNRKMEGFLSLMEIEWRNRISSAAIRTLKERQMNATSLLPLTDDILRLNRHLDATIEHLTQHFDIELNPKNWQKLAVATLCRIILFNKRRSGEASRITLNHYATRPNWTEQCTSELKKTLTPLEISLASRLVIVEVPGKSRRLFKVPILLTESMKTAVDLLIKTRHLTQISSKNNYIFARGNNSLGHLRGHDCLRQICHEIDLQKPELLTGTKLRKYIATVVQVFDLKETEYDWLARHLGHDIKVHRNFYRLHESAVELTKVSRLLLAVDQGEANRYKGKSMEEINIQELPNIDSGVDEASSETDESEPEILTTSDRKSSYKPLNPKKGRGHDILIEDVQNTKRPTKRVPWNPDEVSTVQKFFRPEIKRGSVPGKVRCVECLESVPTVLNRRSWKDIKYYVKNCIWKTLKLKKETSYC